MNLMLYTTLGCHLCEQALQIIYHLQSTAVPELVLTSIDIADDDELVDRYGIRIPVVLVPGYSSDLGWPFDATRLKQYLEQGQ